MRLFLVAVLVIAGLAGVVSASRRSTGPDILRLKDGERISFTRMISEIELSRAVFVGEIHSREKDHRLQLDVIRELRKRGKPVAIGLEMFSADRQGDLDAWVAGRLPVESFRRIYAGEWNIPWRYYRDIFLYARRYRIPLVGLNVPEKITVKVGRLGFESLSSAELAKIPRGITCNVDAKYRAFVTEAYRQHGLDERSFERFCQAQMLWNKVMAWHLAGYLGKNPERVVVVMAGTGHALKRAVPVQLGEYVEVPTAVVLPEDPQVVGSRVTTGDADYLAVTRREGKGSRAR